jgi:hypothetical protein
MNNALTRHVPSGVRFRVREHAAQQKHHAVAAQRHQVRQSDPRVPEPDRGSRDAGTDAFEVSAASCAEDGTIP